MRTKCVQFCSPELGAAINTNANSTRKKIARQLLRFIAAPRCVLWITTRRKVLHRLQHASAKRHCRLPVLRSRRRHASRLVCLPKTGVRSQRQAAVVVQLLSTSPAHRISLALYFDLRPEPQPLPVRPLGQRELRLADFSWKRVAGIEAPSDVYLSILARHRYTKDAGNPRYAIVHKADDEAGMAALLVGPHPRGPNAVADLPGQSVDRARKLAIVVDDSISLDAMPGPQREVARTYVAHVMDHVVGIGHAFIHAQVVRRAVGHADLARNARPRRPIASFLDLLVFNEDGVGPQPVET